MFGVTEDHLGKISVVPSITLWWYYSKQEAQNQIHYQGIESREHDFIKKYDFINNYT